MKPEALIVDTLVAGYVPGFPIVQGASIRAGIGEVVVIIGPNGAGKSTLVKAIAGLVAIESGSVRLAGEEIAALPAEARIARGLGFVPQTGNVFTTLSIAENLIAGAHTVRSGLKMRLDAAYHRFPDLAAKRRARAGTLSGGQRQMLAIARALMTEPSVILLDEPTAGLAPIIVGQVFSDCRRLAESGVSVIIVEQNAKAALRMADRGYVLAEGRNFAEGRAAELLADQALAEAFLGARRQHLAEAVP